MKFLSLITCLVFVLIASGGCSDHDKRLAELHQQIEQLELKIENARGSDDRLFEIGNQREVEETESVIELEGFVYRQKSPRTGAYYQYQHTVEVVVKNVSQRDYQFEIISFGIEPINSRGIVLLHKASSAKMGNRFGVNLENIVGEKWVLPPGESENFCFRTGMRREALLEHSLDLPFLVRVKIQDERQTIAEYTTALPNLDGLPELPRDHDGTFVGTGDKLDLIKTRRFIAPEGSPRIY